MSINIGMTTWGAAAAPASLTKAGFEALSWVQHKGTEVAPVFGQDHATQEVPDLATGETTGHKGQASGKETTTQYHGTGGDTGITALILAAKSRPGIYSLKIARGSGTMGADGPAVESGDVVEYASGYVHNHVPNANDSTTHEGGTVSFKQNGITVVDVEPS